MGDPYPNFCLCAFLGPYCFSADGASPPRRRGQPSDTALARHPLGQMGGVKARGVRIEMETSDLESFCGVYRLGLGSWLRIWI